MSVFVKAIFASCFSLTNNFLSLTKYCSFTNFFQHQIFVRTVTTYCFFFVSTSHHSIEIGIYFLYFFRLYIFMSDFTVLFTLLFFGLTWIFDSYFISFFCYQDFITAFLLLCTYFFNLWDYKVWRFSKSASIFVFKARRLNSFDMSSRGPKVHVLWFFLDSE